MNTQSYEVEVKIPIQDTSVIETSLINLGASKYKIEFQTDIYLNHPCKSFEDTDEALRIRECKNIPLIQDSAPISQPEREITYKGPKIDTSTKTRLELSLEIKDINTALSIFENLGFRNVATIRKRRSYFLLDATVLSIDEVEHVGTFLELERVVYSQDEIDSARSLIFSQLESLNLKQEQTIRDSYLEIYMRKMHL